MSYCSTHAIRIPNSGRSISDDDWKIIEPRHLNTWKRATDLLKEYHLSVNSKEIVIEANWNPLVRRHQRYIAAMERIERNVASKQQNPLEDANFPARNTIVKLRVKSSTALEASPLDLCSLAIHDAFLMLNIAEPACCDFYLSSFIRERHSPEISLSNIHFESGLNVYMDHGWPPISSLELDKVLHWYRRARTNTKQLPHNPMERALFAMLHICRADLSPMTVIWMFNLLESLFQTRAGENFNTLTRRICLLLDANPTHEKITKKNLRALYDIRSSIVHGGYEMPHPIHNEIIDRRVGDSLSQLIEATDYGFALIVSSIQRIVSNGWIWPRFAETIGGNTDI